MFGAIAARGHRSIAVRRYREIAAAVSRWCKPAGPEGRPSRAEPAPFFRRTFWSMVTKCCGGIWVHTVLVGTKGAVGPMSTESDCGYTPQGRGLFGAIAARGHRSIAMRRYREIAAAVSRWCKPAGPEGRPSRAEPAPLLRLASSAGGQLCPPIRIPPGVTSVCVSACHVPCCLPHCTLPAWIAAQI